MDIFAEEYNVKSNQHFEGMKKDLISLSTNNVYFDIECKCKDGTLKTNRFYIGMIFPQIQDQTTVLFPDHCVREITGQIRQMFDYLCHIEGGYNDNRAYELSMPEVNEDPLAINPPSDVRKIIPREGLIAPDFSFATHFLEEDTNLYTAKPQAPPNPKVINRPSVPTTFQSSSMTYIQPQPAPIQTYQQSNTITYGFPNTLNPSQPKKVIVHHQPNTSYGQAVNQNYPIMVDQYGNKLPVIFKPLPTSQPQPQTYQTVKTIPGTYMRPNGKTPISARPPNPNIVKGIRPPIAGVINPPGAADQVLVAKAPISSIPMFSKSANSTLVTASSIKNVMKKNLYDDIAPRDKIYDDKGRCIGYKSSNGFEGKGGGPFGSFLSKSHNMVAKQSTSKSSIISGVKRAAYEDVSDVDLSSDDDTIEMVESGVEYLVNSVKARIKKPKIRCFMVKLTAAELTAVKLQEAAEEKEQPAKISILTPQQLNQT